MRISYDFDLEEWISKVRPLVQSFQLLNDDIYDFWISYGRSPSSQFSVTCKWPKDVIVIHP